LKVNRRFRGASPPSSRPKNKPSMKRVASRNLELLLAQSADINLEKAFTRLLRRKRSQSECLCPTGAVCSHPFYTHSPFTHTALPSHPYLSSHQCLHSDPVNRPCIAPGRVQTVTAPPSEVLTAVTVKRNVTICRRFGRRIACILRRYSKESESSYSACCMLPDRCLLSPSSSLRMEAVFSSETSWTIGMHYVISQKIILFSMITVVRLCKT
jgi:hypothetical protein